MGEGCEIDATTLAVLTPTRTPDYLPASPGDVGRAAHTHARSLALSLPLLLTDLGSALAPTPHTLHAITSAVLTPTQPPNYLAVSL
jgi:hypothetical protein